MVLGFRSQLVLKPAVTGWIEKIRAVPAAGSSPDRPAVLPAGGIGLWEDGVFRVPSGSRQLQAGRLQSIEMPWRILAKKCGCR